MAVGVRDVAAGVAGAGVMVVTGVLVALVLAIVVGGSVYRTDCTFDNGTHTTSWGLEGDIPYLWSPGDNRCEAHTLTRYVLGQVGLMGRVTS